MLRRPPVGSVVEHLIAGGLHREAELSCCLATASVLLQQSLAAWRHHSPAIVHTRSISSRPDVDVSDTTDGFTSAAQYQPTARYHSSSAAAAGTRDLLSRALSKELQNAGPQRQQKPNNKALKQPQKAVDRSSVGLQSQPKGATTEAAARHALPLPRPPEHSPSTAQLQQQLSYLQSMKKAFKGGIKQPVVKDKDDSLPDQQQQVPASPSTTSAPDQQQQQQQQQQGLQWEQCLLPPFMHTILIQGLPYSSIGHGGCSDDSSSNSSGGSFTPAELDAGVTQLFQSAMHWWEDEQAQLTAAAAAAAEEEDDDDVYRDEQQGLQHEAWYDISRLMRKLGSSDTRVNGADDDGVTCQSAAGVELEADDSLMIEGCVDDTVDSPAVGSYLDDDVAPVGRQQAHQQQFIGETATVAASATAAAPDQQQWQQSQQQLRQGMLDAFLGNLLQTYNKGRDRSPMQDVQQQQQQELESSSAYHDLSIRAGELQWPVDMSHILLAVQYGTLQLSGLPAPGRQLHTVPQYTSSSSSDSGSSTGLSVSSDCLEEPFAWMYSSTRVDDDGCELSSSNSGVDVLQEGDIEVLQHVVNSITDTWRFELPYSSSSSSSSGGGDSTTSTGSDSSSSSTETLHQQQQQQPQIDQPPQRSTSAESVILPVVFDFLAGFLGVKTPADMSPTPQQQESQQQQQQEKESQQQQQQPQLQVHQDVAGTSEPSPATALAAAAAAAVDDISAAPTQPDDGDDDDVPLQVPPSSPPSFKLKHGSRYTQADITMLYRVINMSRGTDLQAPLWSELSGVVTRVTDEAIISPKLTRYAVSRPAQRKQQQQQQQVVPEVGVGQQKPAQQQDSLQQQNGLRAALAEFVRNQEVPGINWFMPLVYAAFTASHSSNARIGQLFLEDHTTAGAEEHMEEYQEQQGKCFDAWTRQQQVLPAGAAGSSGRGLRVDTKLQQEISSSRSSLGLAAVWRDYLHYWPRNPEAVDALMKQAATVWTRLRNQQQQQQQQQQGGSQKITQLIAETWPTDNQLIDQEQQQSGGALVIDSRDDILSTVAAATAAANGTTAASTAAAAAKSGMTEYEAAVQVYSALVQWFTGQAPVLRQQPTVNLIALASSLQHDNSISNCDSSSRSVSAAVDAQSASRHLLRLFRLLVQCSSSSSSDSSGSSHAVLSDSRSWLPVLRSSLTDSLYRFTDAELTDLYFTLTQWDKLGTWDSQQQQQAAALYAAVVEHMAKRSRQQQLRRQEQQQQQSSLGAQLSLTEHALAAVAESASINISRGLQARVQQHDTAAAAATVPILAAAANTAAARGQLQQVAGMLAPLLKHIQQQQQSDSSDVRVPGNLTQRLFDILETSAAVASVSRGQETKAAITGIAGSINRYLTKPQQQQDGDTAGAVLPLTELSPSQLVSCLAALQTLGLTDAAQQFVICLSKATSTSSTNSSSSTTPLLYSFTLSQINDVIRKCKAMRIPVKPIADSVAAAAAHRARLLAEYVSSPTSSSSGGSSTRWQQADSVLSEVSELGQLSVWFHHSDNVQLDLLRGMDDVLVACSRNRSIHSFNTQALTQFAGSLAKFHYCSAAAANAVQQLTSLLLPHCTVSDAARLAWSLAVLDQRDATVWSNLRQAIAHISVREIREKRHRKMTAAAASDPETPPIWMSSVLAALYQASLFVRHHVPGVSDLLQPDLQQVARLGWLSNTAEVTVSQLQRDVSHAISALQAQPNAQVHRYELESRTELSSADILVRVVDRDVIIEVDGPRHYAINDKYWRLGSSELRDLLMAAAGFRVLPLPYFVWNKMEGLTEAQRLKELEKMLHQVAKDGTILWKTPEWCMRFGLPYSAVMRSSSYKARDKGGGTGGRGRGTNRS